MILQNRHHIGVSVFCFAHVAYIIRALDVKYEGRLRVLYLLPAIGVVFTVLLLGSIYIAAALYAALFIVNIYVSARHIQHNRKLVMAGLLLFAACDICVLIFNLPAYFGAPVGLRMVFPLIWVFYLPSQVVLAVSGVGFRGMYFTNLN